MKPLSVALGLWLALCFSAAPSDAQFDADPPSLQDFDFNPKSVDVTAGPAAVTCSMTLTDSPAGVLDTTCWLFGPGTQDLGCTATSPSSGDIHSGVWSCTVMIPQYSEEGTWRVAYVSARDNAENDFSRDTSALQQLGFPTQLQVTSSTADAQPPSLQDFDFNPKSVDVTAGPAAVTCSMTLTDSPAGVLDTTCWLFGPGTQDLGCTATSPSSGDIHSGVWSCTVMIPQYSEEGTWRVAYVSARDNAENDFSRDTSALQQLGFPTQLQVTSSTADAQPPSLQDFDFNPKSVDVTAGPAAVTCSMTLTDSPAGVLDTTCWLFGPGTQDLGCTATSPSSGDIHSGVWSCTVMIPQYSEEGTWRVAYVSARDNAENDFSRDTSALQQLGFPIDLRVGFLEGSPRAEVISPVGGKRIRGNSVTVRARLTSGSPDDVSVSLGVRFDYRALPFGGFAPIAASGANHPNPDINYPYFIHWNVSEVADGDYELRAVAHDVAGTPDPAPERIIITVDHGGPVDVDENSDAEGRQDSQIRVDDLAESRAASGDRTATSAATELILPAGALNNPVDKVRLYYPDPTLEALKLEQADQGLGIFVDLSLESGQPTLENGVVSDLNISYADSDADGVVDGTSIRDDELELRRYDAGSDSYLIVPSSIMTEHNMVHTSTSVTGRFALTGPQLPTVEFAADKESLTWHLITAASSYNVYRGVLAGLVDLDSDGLPDSGYGECQNSRDSDVTDGSFIDGETPSTPGAGYTYLVSFVGGSGESSLGNTRAGRRRTVVAVCP